MTNGSTFLYLIAKDIITSEASRDNLGEERWAAEIRKGTNKQEKKDSAQP